MFLGATAGSCPSIYEQEIYWQIGGILHVRQLPLEYQLKLSDIYVGISLLLEQRQTDASMLFTVYILLLILGGSSYIVALLLTHNGGRSIFRLDSQRIRRGMWIQSSQSVFLRVGTCFRIRVGKCFPCRTNISITGNCWHFQKPTFRKFDAVIHRD